MKTVTNLNSSIYYHGQYWNDIPYIEQYISQILTGDKDKWWIENFKEKYASEPFKYALFLNCGDGRWEREFIDRKIVKKVLAFDISPDLIKKAKSLKGKRNIRYLIADANKATFNKNSFDLVVNIAALHHVQYLNRICYILANALKKDGMFISYDFVGPGRNQYPIINYGLIRLVNALLPKTIRKSPLGYPHLPTMLDTDPTEAIHANLIDKTLKRYFLTLDKRIVGGGIAYEIFTHNKNFLKRQKYTKTTLKQINKVLIIDKLLTRFRIIPAFFSFSLLKPNKPILRRNLSNKNFQLNENKREEQSQRLYGVYGFKDFVLILIHTGSWNKRIRMIIKYVLYALW